MLTQKRCEVSLPESAVLNNCSCKEKRGGERRVIYHHHFVVHGHLVIELLYWRTDLSEGLAAALRMRLIVSITYSFHSWKPKSHFDN